MVLINGSNLGELIIANGNGWVYRKYCAWGFCDDWLNLENQVRERRLGLWADKHPIAPWEWRSQQREGNNSSGRVGAGGSVYKYALARISHRGSILSNFSSQKPGASFSRFQTTDSMVNNHSFSTTFSCRTSISIGSSVNRAHFSSGMGNLLLSVHVRRGIFTIFANA